MSGNSIVVNGEIFKDFNYQNYHNKRVEFSIKKLIQMDAINVVELGGHPWFMTSSIIDADKFNLCATISAEEIIGIILINSSHDSNLSGNTKLRKLFL